IREYAQQRLAETGEAEQARSRHLAYYLALAEAAEPALRGPDQLQWLNRLDSELDNLRAALAYAVQQPEPELAMRLAAALATFWSMRQFGPEGRGWLEAALDLRARLAIAVPSRVLAQARLRAGSLNIRSDLDASLAHLEAAVDLYRQLGDSAGVARAQTSKGMLLRARSDYAGAVEQFQAALPYWLEAGDHWNAANCLHFLGHVMEDGGGDRSSAAAYYQRSLDLFRQVGDRWEQTGPLNDLARQAWSKGDIAAGKSFFEQSMAIGYELGGRASAYDMLNVRASLLTEQGHFSEALEVIGSMQQVLEVDDPTSTARQGEVAYLRGHLAEATRLYEHALEAWRAENERHGQAWPLARLGCVAYRGGDLDEAARLLEVSLEHLGPGGWYWNRALVLLVQGDIARTRGQFAAAATLYASSLRLLSSSPRDVPDRLEAFAKLAGAIQQPQRAAQLFGAASDIRRRLGVPLPPVEQTDYEIAIAHARAQLSPAAFDAAWAAGAALTEAQAVELALADPAPDQVPDP
ncbi:MAG: tetratricopeptide repeat protein, partial [Anaerolineales bacterium]